MKKEKSQKVLLSGIAMVVLFILWTVAISLIDVQPIGPQNSSVGFATLNGFIHSLTGVHMAIYTVIFIYSDVEADVSVIRAKFNEWRKRL